MGIFEQLQAQGERTEAMLGQILSHMKVSEDPVWRTPGEIRDMFRLERRMYKELLEEGVRKGVIKTLIFTPHSLRPQQRIDATSFEAFLKAGGITSN